MKCAWNAYLNLLPTWMRSQVDKLGREDLQELRMRIGRPPELVCKGKHQYLDRMISNEDLSYCLNAASQYSPWSSTTISSGYITAAGGHRIGFCGQAAIVDRKVTTLTHLTSLCVRVARDFPGIGLLPSKAPGSLLIIGRPGRGKTTLLRDIIRQKSNEGGAVAVVDERGELFPVAEGRFCFFPGQNTDIMSGCSKVLATQMLIRTMNPNWLAVDEITAAQDCKALIGAMWCGVKLLATAHAGDLQEFLSRPVYRPLYQSGLFDQVIVMQEDMSWKLEEVRI